MRALVPDLLDRDLPVHDLLVHDLLVHDLIVIVMALRVVLPLWFPTFVVLTFIVAGKILRTIGCERNDKGESVQGGVMVGSDRLSPADFPLLAF